MSRIPDITVHIQLVEHGYEIDILIDDIEVTSICRDFGKSYDIERLKTASYQIVSEALQPFRERIEEILGGSDD